MQAILGETTGFTMGRKFRNEKKKFHHSLFSRTYLEIFKIVFLPNFPHHYYIDFSHFVCFHRNKTTCCYPIIFNDWLLSPFCQMLYQNDGSIVLLSCDFFTMPGGHCDIWDGWQQSKARPGGDLETREMTSLDAPAASMRIGGNHLVKILLGYWIWPKTTTTKSGRIMMVFSSASRDMVAATVK